MEKENIVHVPITKILDLPEYPYKIRDDESMDELVQSIKQCGLIQPVIIRPLENNMYEMISGHRRKRAFEIAGIKTIPARIKHLTKDEAIIAMVDSNMQRESILPSEKAKAYKLKLEAMKRQGYRSDLTSSPVGGKLIDTAEKVGEEAGDSASQVRRYIHLNDLIEPLLDMVDEGKIAMRPAVELSYLPDKAQEELLNAIKYFDATPSHYQAIRMKNFYAEGNLTNEIINNIMQEEKPNQKIKPVFNDSQIKKLIPKTVPEEKQFDYILKALDFYNKYLQRKRAIESR